MKKLEVQELLEVRELKERISELLRLVEEEGETIEVINHGEVIARLVPAHAAKQLSEQDIKAFWADMDRLAVEIGAHWTADVSAVEAVRDVRREL